ncbi:IclR family transcriptional regulator [Paenibacillus sp.]|uniref:IclR family transcriptional regulator n=1 Tax=Paenibacillus sp. TaxID=58172 RepID=UPI002D66E5E7|nr:IclR family transcriptional regulator [Paenibacillus sp.]HZG56357.1 IclR family transcriptional regulator [Paenibacillus sp.]
MPIIQAVDRALQLLELFDEQTKELKITEISARVRLHKSTVHSLLKTLQLRGYIEQDEDSGKYRLGMKLLERGQLLLQGLDLRGIAGPALRELSEATGQTAHLVVMDGPEAVYIDKVEGEKAAIRYSRIGRRVPFHSSAVGKALAAYQSPKRLERLLAGYRFEKHTAATIDSREAFLAELERVRAEGVAYDREENEPGVLCAAAPIFDYAGDAVAAMSVSALAARIDAAELGRNVTLLRACARRISEKLGHREESGINKP